MAARHYLSASTGGSTEAEGFPIFTDNPSFNVSGGGATTVNLLRAIIFAASGSRIQVMGHNQTWSNNKDSGAFLGGEELTNGLARRFKLMISSSAGTGFANDDSNAGIKVYTASFDPSDDAL